MQITIYPGNAPIPVALGASGATVANRGPGTLSYGTNDEPVAIGTIASGATSTLYDSTEFFTTGSSRCEVQITSLAASSSSSSSTSYGEPSYNVKTDYGAKGDVRTFTDGAMNSGSALLTSASSNFVGSDVGKAVLVQGAGALWNARGAWVASTSYAAGDTVTKDGLTWVCQVANSSSFWNPVYWAFAVRTRRSLGGWISAVNAGVATLVTTAGGSTPATASATVSGQTGYYGTDDSTAFQSFFTALHASTSISKGIVPLADYIMMNTVLSGGSNIEVANGARFRLPGVIPFGPALIYAASSGDTRDSNIYFGSQGVCYFDFTGVDPNNFIHGIFATTIQDYKFEGISMLNSPDGNAITTYPGGTNNLYPLRGIIERIDSSGTAQNWGFGPVQIDAADELIVRRITTDLSRAVNVETDDSGPVKVAKNITIERVSSNARATMTYPNSAVGLIAHGNTISNVTVRDVVATGSSDGVIYSMNTSTGLDKIIIDGVRVTGGGRGVFNQSTDVSYNDFVVRNVSVDGSAIFNPFASAYDPGMNYGPGMVMEDVRVDSGLGPGFQAIFQTNGPLGRGTHTRCRARGNIQGWDNRYMQQLNLVDCEAEDNPWTTFPFLSTQYDLQVSAGNWAVIDGHTTATRTVGTRRYLRLVSDGASSGLGVMTPTGTSGFAVTANSYYRGAAYAQAVVGTLQEIHVKIFWYTSGGAAASTASTLSTGTTMVTGAAVYENLVAQAPANAAFAAMQVIVFHNSGGTNFTASDESRVIPVNFGKVAGVGGTQTTGVKAAQGIDISLTNCLLNGNTSTRVQATGSPLVLETLSRDVLTIS